MLTLSQTTGYAILALACLEDSPQEWVQARDIARRTGISLPYLSKMLHSLTRRGLVQAKRGYRGGFQLTRPADQITLRQIAEAIEDENWGCLLGLEACSDERHCPTHEFWTAERAKIQAELQRITLREVASFERNNGTRILPRRQDLTTRDEGAAP